MKRIMMGRRQAWVKIEKLAGREINQEQGGGIPAEPH